MKCFSIICAVLFSATLCSASTDSEWIGKILKEKFATKSVVVHTDNKNGFIAKVGDSLILVGGIGQSSDMQISMDRANFAASAATAAFIQGKFGTGETVPAITISTAFAQKGEWLVEKDKKYICIHVLDANKVSYK